MLAAACTQGKRDLLVRLLEAGARVPPVLTECRSYLLSDPDMLRLVFHSGQIPSKGGFNRVHYQNSDVDRLIETASATAADDERRRLYGEVQQAVARDVPYIPLWYKTNIAVFQPNISGVRLSPIADFTFLKDVQRTTER